MFGRILLIIGSIFLFPGCKSSSKQPEGYNSVTITEYVNTYDAHNRIITAQGTESNYTYFGKNYETEVFDGTTSHTKKYSYLNDSCYTVEEPLTDSWMQTMRYTGKTTEELVLENGKDTIHYSLDRNNDRNKPEYGKRISLSKFDPSSDSRYEDYYDYEGNENYTKVVSHDLITGQKEETYKFGNIDYKKALSLVPSSDAKQNIECNFTQVVNDTSITRTTLNDVLNRVVKEYMDGEKGLKVNVNCMIRSTGYSVDSIYYKGNKKVKHIINSDFNGVVGLEISEYDEQGNVIKKISKLRWAADNKMIR